MTTKTTFTQIAQVLRAAYFKAAISDDTWLTYFMALADIPDAALIRAVSEHVAHEDDFPTIAQLRRLALGDNYPSPGDAWGEVMRQMREVGGYRSPDFSHVLIGQAVEHIGGWQALCKSDNLVADRAHFLRLYGELVRRDMAGKVSFSILKKTAHHRSPLPQPIGGGIQALEDQHPGDEIHVE